VLRTIMHCEYYIYEYIANILSHGYLRLSANINFNGISHWAILVPQHWPASVKYNTFYS